MPVVSSCKCWRIHIRYTGFKITSNTFFLKILSFSCNIGILFKPLKCSLRCILKYLLYIKVISWVKYINSRKIYIKCYFLFNNTICTFSTVARRQVMTVAGLLPLARSFPPTARITEEQGPSGSRLSEARSPPTACTITPGTRRPRQHESPMRIDIFKMRGNEGSKSLSAYISYFVSCKIFSSICVYTITLDNVSFFFKNPSSWSLATSIGNVAVNRWSK